MPKAKTRLLACLVSWAALTGGATAAELSIKIKPANKALRENVKNHIGDLGDRDVEALQRYTRIAQSKALTALQALGYYSPTITTEVLHDPPKLVVNIVPGQPILLDQIVIDVEGPATELDKFKVPRDTLKQGEILNQGEYEDVKQSIANQAARYGFFNGKFTRHRLRIDPAEHTADVDLKYKSGPRFRLGDVLFNEVPLDQSLLQRMVPFKKGTPYDAADIAKLNQDLQSSGYFESVRVDVKPETAVDEEIPVDVHLLMRQPRTLNVGLGYSTDIGPRARFSWTRHWANAKGHSYGFESEISTPRQNVGFWYDIPGKHPLTNKMRWAGGYQYEQLDNTDTLSRRFDFGPEWHRKFHSGWTQIISLKWQREEYKLGDDSGLSTMLLPGISYSYLESDNAINPNHGYRLQADLSVAKRGLMSDADLARTNFLWKGLTTVWEKHRFLGRLQFGGNFSDEYKKVPPSMRYFAGGDQSVRGYDYQHLSPEDRRGDRVGGRYQFTSSLEYQYSLTEKWRLATFVDRGNAFDTLSKSDMKTGVGVGVRWVSPVGPLRLDLAKPLDKPNPGSRKEAFRIHFSMGAEL